MEKVNKQEIPFFNEVLNLHINGNLKAWKNEIRKMGVDKLMKYLYWLWANFPETKTQDITEQLTTFKNME